jgi:hypothetical protein
LAVKRMLNSYCAVVTKIVFKNDEIASVNLGASSAYIKQ